MWDASARPAAAEQWNKSLFGCRLAAIFGCIFGSASLMMHCSGNSSLLIQICSAAAMQDFSADKVWIWGKGERNAEHHGKGAVHQCTPKWSTPVYTRQGAIDMGQRWGKCSCCFSSGFTRSQPCIPCGFTSKTSQPSHIILVSVFHLYL